MADLKTTKQERALLRLFVELERERRALNGEPATQTAVLANLLDDLGTLEAENAALRAALDGVAMARVTEYGVELSRELLSTIYALTEDDQ